MLAGENGRVAEKPYRGRSKNDLASSACRQNGTHAPVTVGDAQKLQSRVMREDTVRTSRCAHEEPIGFEVSRLSSRRHDGIESTLQAPQATSFQMVLRPLLRLSRSQLESDRKLVQGENGRSRKKGLRIPPFHLTIRAHTWDSLPFISTDCKVALLNICPRKSHAPPTGSASPRLRPSRRKAQGRSSVQHRVSLQNRARCVFRGKVNADSGRR